MMKTIRFFLLVLSSFFILSCTKDQEGVERFQKQAEVKWKPHHYSYSKMSSSFFLRRGCYSQFDFYTWVIPQIAAGEQKSQEQFLEEYLDATVCAPEQLYLAIASYDEVVSPDSQMMKRLHERRDECANLYIQHCIKSGKYKEYLSYWELPKDGNYYSFNIRDRWCYLYYSDISIVSLDITSSETFFGVPPGSSLSRYFNVVFSQSSIFLFDKDGNVVDEGPIGGEWSGDYAVRPDEMNKPWPIEKLLHFKPRVFPFLLQMSKKPAERPSSADFTVTIGYSDGSECTSTLSVNFLY